MSGGDYSQLQEEVLSLGDDLEKLGGLMADRVATPHDVEDAMETAMSRLDAMLARAKSL